MPVITQNRIFVLVIRTVTAAFFVSLIGLPTLSLVADNPPTPMQMRSAEVFDIVAKVTIGALVGLLGGRGAAPDRIEAGPRK